MNKLKFGDLLILTICAALVSASICGCALFDKRANTDQKLADVRNLCYAAASLGTAEAILQNPGWRLQFDAAEIQLDQLVSQKVVTGDLLRGVIASLPVKELKNERARIAIESATTLFDASVGSRLNIEQEPYVLAAATGIRDGLKVAV